MAHSIHKQIKITLRQDTLWADVEIIPLLKWMYSFPSVKTYHSCWGGATSNIWHTLYPYVLFSCNNKDLIQIGKAMCNDCRVYIECEFDEDSPPVLKYALRSQSINFFRKVVKQVTKDVDIK